MRTFPGWRNVGRAMQCARRQDSVTCEILGHKGRLIEAVWRDENGAHVAVTDLEGGGDHLSLYLATSTGGLVDGDHLTAAEVLGILAGLRLIPDELAQVHDEKYGRCVKCNQTCMWDDGHGTWEPRWLHLNPFRGQGHRAEAIA